MLSGQLVILNIADKLSRLTLLLNRSRVPELWGLITKI